MSEPMTREELDEIRKAEREATPGPWMWDMRSKHNIAQITTAHSGRCYVMGFERWGMQSACPTFQVYTKYEGPVKERGSNGMVRAEKLAKPIPGKEHHFGYEDDIDHPDARFMIVSRAAVPRLLAEVDRLQSALDAAVRRAEAAEKQLCEIYDCALEKQEGTEIYQLLEAMMDIRAMARATGPCANNSPEQGGEVQP